LLRAEYDAVMTECPDTVWVLAGYSQGALVVTEAVKSFRADRVVYVALFGDPKLYLPEGKGILPDACLGRNYSPYRIYVPNCRTSEGRLKARNPYIYGELTGKYGLWCNAHDFVCGSALLPWDTDGHLQYVERMPQLVGILRGRLPYNTHVRSMGGDSDIYAQLPLDTYYARPGEEIIFDASSSFSLAVDICDYAWSVDGGEFQSTSAQLTQSFGVGEHSVTVRVTDCLDATAEYTSKVVVAEDFESELLPSPVGVVARRVDNEIVLDWSEASVAAPYLWVRMNDFDLGYASAEQRTLTITDVDFSEEIVLEVAWLSEDSMSEWREVGWVENESDEPAIEPVEPLPTESPHTGVTFADGILPCLMIIACAMVVRKLLR
jgi:hypothetical protein